MGGNGAVLDGRHVDNGAVVHLPCDRVTVLRRGEGRGVDRVAGDGSDRGRPTREGVGVFRSRGFRGGRAVVGRRGAFGNARVGLEDGAVPVLPGHGVGDVVVVADEEETVRSRAVVEGDAFGADEVLPLGIGLAVRVVRLEDRVGAGRRHALEVAAGDQRRACGIGVVVLICVGRRGLGFVDAAGDRRDLRIGGVVDRVVAGGGAVRVDLKTFAELVDRRQIGRVRASILDADAVRGDDRIPDAADMRAQVGILIGRGAGGAVRVGGCVDALSERTGVAVDAADLLLRCGGDRHGAAAAVDRGDIAEVDDDLIGSAEAAAFADEVDHGRGIGRSVDPCFVAVDNGAGGIRSCDGDDVEDIARVSGDSPAAVIEHGRIGGGDRVVRQRAEMTAVIHRVSRGAGNSAVVHRADRRRGALIARGEVGTVVLRRREFRCAGIVAHNVALGVRTVNGVDEDVLRAGKAAVPERVDNAAVAESEGRILRNGDAVYDVDRGRRVIIMVGIGRDEEAFVCERLPRQRMPALAAVAVEDHRVAFACARGSGCEVRVAEGADIALVLEQKIAVRAGADEVYAVDRFDPAALFKVSDVGLSALRFGRSIGVAGIGANEIIARYSTAAGVQQRVVVRGDREAGGSDRNDMTAVHDRIIAARGDRAVRRDALDLGGLAVGRDVMELNAADLVAVGVDGLESKLTVVIQRAVAAGVDQNRAFDGADDAARRISKRIVGGNGFRVVRVLIGLDLGRAADRADYAAVVVERTAVIGAGARVFGIDAAIDDRIDRRAAGFAFLIIIGAGITAARDIRAFPDVRVVPPVVAVENRVALHVAMDVGRRGSVGVDLGGVGMRGEGGVVELVDRRAVVERVLTGGDCRILDEVDRAVIRYGVAGGDGGCGADIAVIDAVGAVDGAGIDQLDIAAVVEDRVAARGEDRDVRERGDGRAVVHNDGDVAVDVLQVFESDAGDAHRAAAVVADNGGMVRNARVADRVRGDSSAAGAVLNGQITAVGDGCHRLICCRCSGRAALVMEAAAVHFEDQGTLVDDATDGAIAVQVERQRRRSGHGVRRGAALLFKRTAVRDKADGACAGSRNSRHRSSEGGIIGVGKAVVSNRAGIEAVDIGVAACIADGNGAVIGVAARCRNAGEIPDDRIMRFRSNAHLRVGRRGEGGTDVHRRVRFFDDVISLAVDCAGLGDSVPGEAAVVIILRFVQHEGRDELCGGTGQVHDGILRNIRNVDVRAADGD